MLRFRSFRRWLVIRGSNQITMVLLHVRGIRRRLLIGGSIILGGGVIAIRNMVIERGIVLFFSI